MRILCALGRHNYGDPRRGEGDLFVEFIPAMRALGHHVEHFEIWDKSAHTDFAGLNRELLQTLADGRFDLLFLVPTLYEVWTETLDALRHSQSATLLWTTDDSWKYHQQSRYLAAHVDLVTTTYQAIVGRYLADGHGHVSLTQWGVASDRLQQPVAASDCTHDVTFIGSCTPGRRRWVKALALEGVQVDCFGHGWPAGTVSSQEVLRIFRQSRVSLNFSSPDPTSRFGRPQLKARTFEVPGAGGLLLTEDAPGLEAFYKHESEIMVFRSTEEAAAHVTYLLANPRKRDAIAAAGHERTRHDHTYECRLRPLLAKAQDVINLRKRTIHGSQGWPPASVLDGPCESHKLSTPLRVFRTILVAAAVGIFGTARGPRAARRALFEASWRFAGRTTYSARGWPGRLFYLES